jgi:hypothetical protein
MTFFGIDFPFQPPGPIRQASPLRLLLHRPEPGIGFGKHDAAIKCASASFVRLKRRTAR